MYGSATELVMTFYGKGVHRFTLDPSLGEFIHIEANVRIPDKPKVMLFDATDGAPSYTSYCVGDVALDKEVIHAMVAVPQRR